MSFNRPRGKKLRLEELEARLAPANDLFTVPPADVSGGQVQLRFEREYSSAAFKNEVGVYAVDDANGRVNGLLPTDVSYAGQALLRSQVVFGSGTKAGAKNSLAFNAGQLLGLYIVSNGTTAQALAGQRLAYFTFDAANADHFDHARANIRGDGGSDFRFEDTFGGGDRDYNDAVVSVSKTHAIATPGQIGQTVQASFLQVSKQAAYHNEVGLVRVDNSDGSLGSLKPGDAGYVQALLSSSTRQVIFSDTTLPGVTNRTLTLEGGQQYVFYIVTNGTTEQLLSTNASNTVGAGPLAYFSFASANPDSQEHLNWHTSNEFGLEDLPGLGDADFNDMVIRYGFAPPQGTPGTPATPTNAPPTISGIADQTVDQNGGTSALPFTVSDDKTPASDLTVTASSSNQTLVPDANVVLGGSGASRTVTVTPAANQSGTAQITLTVSDGTATSSASFNLTVNAVTGPPTFTASNPPTAPFNSGTQQQTVPGFATFVPGSSGSQTAAYIVSAVSNTALFSTQPTVSSDGTLRYTPVAGGFGSSTFTLTVNDGTATSAPKTFTITVDPVQGAPSIVNGSDGNNISLINPNWQTIPTVVNATNPAGIPAGTYPDGTRILDLTVGTGPALTSNSTFTGTFKGYLINGTNFQSGPLTASNVQDFIPGFSAGLVGMQAGGKRQIDISSYLGYGANPPTGSGIPANSRLIFEVTVTSIP